MIFIKFRERNHSVVSVYEIAQGALQLTGTSVGILNQAAEGKWFNTFVEEARNVSFFLSYFFQLI